MPGNMLGCNHCRLDLLTNWDHGMDLQSPSLIVSRGLNIVPIQASCHSPRWLVDTVGAGGNQGGFHGRCYG